ncbi:hypothetical protein LINPERHAP1_LOCUS21763, partial [Linum perenne]
RTTPYRLKDALPTAEGHPKTHHQPQRRIQGPNSQSSSQGVHITLVYLGGS